MSDLLEVARKEALPQRSARIIAVRDTPYRCIGGAIYTLQMAGFIHVKFKAPKL
ncbi:hypothetical protein [Sphingomonas xinjiangensis]|uniref:Uncharacterized protein n=1 Tax=Sphingomonas xinjiangensis TaxID=643568 RepID=A0A840YPQ6_9SPHN|nr:hypothetical protein [Sphingomonas xinjiangensis]MBB5709613.1 hypothetical protein [Sphingomonas xinjiangensis]